MKNKKEITEYISVDFSLFESRNTFHLIMKMIIGSDVYTGNSLDSLHDALTSICKKTVFVITNEEAGRANFGGYFDSIMRVFRDSAEENEMISFVTDDTGEEKDDTKS